MNSRDFLTAGLVVVSLEALDCQENQQYQNNSQGINVVSSTEQLNMATQPRASSTSFRGGGSNDVNLGLQPAPVAFLCDEIFHKADVNDRLGDRFGYPYTGENGKQAIVCVMNIERKIQFVLDGDTVAADCSHLKIVPADNCKKTLTELRHNMGKIFSTEPGNYDTFHAYHKKVDGTVFGYSDNDIQKPETGEYDFEKIKVDERTGIVLSRVDGIVNFFTHLGSSTDFKILDEFSLGYQPLDPIGNPADLREKIRQNLNRKLHLQREFAHIVNAGVDALEKGTYKPL